MILAFSPEMEMVPASVELVSLATQNDVSIFSPLMPIFGVLSALQP